MKHFQPFMPLQDAIRQLFLMAVKSAQLLMFGNVIQILPTICDAPIKSNLMKAMLKFVKLM